VKYSSLHAAYTVYAMTVLLRNAGFTDSTVTPHISGVTLIGGKPGVPTAAFNQAPSPQSESAATLRGWRISGTRGGVSKARRQRR
jgi:hypothetical protein